MVTMVGFLGGEVQEMMEYDGKISMVFPNSPSFEKGDDADQSIGHRR